MLRGSVLCIVHQRTSFPGRIGRLFMERGYALDVRCPNIGQALPQTTDEYVATVLFGGPMSANDEHEPAIAEELRWTERMLARDAPLVGICLGAQIMARALGANVAMRADGVVEVGYTEVRPTQDGCELFDGPLTVYQWHKEGFDLPKGARLLASGGDAFPNQAFGYGENAIALQFHPDVTKDMMQRWCSRGTKMLAMPGAMPPDEQLRQHPAHEPPFEVWSARLVDRLIARGGG